MINYHMNIVQGSYEWEQLRLGVLTASTMGTLFTKSMALSKGAGVETLMYRLLAERINGWAPEGFTSFDMERGHYEEDLALAKYSECREQVTACGFVENDEHGFKIGYSPDALVGDEGLIEVKSRKHEFQVRTIFESLDEGWKMPEEYRVQVQTGLLVTGRKWCDFISYSNGMPMAIIREFPDLEMQEKIISAATAFEAKLASAQNRFVSALASCPSLIPTERDDYERDGGMVV